MPENKKRPDQAIVQNYINEAIKKLEENPSSLEKHERRLLTKFKKVSESAQKAAKDIQDLSNQITQAQARKNSLELQIENLQGSANAYVDELVSLKYDVEDDALPSPEGETNA
jgi:chromosome segregation ATPase